MAFYVYILRCADGRYYTGHTDDLELRLAQHQSGLFPGFTASRLPVTLLWAQDFQTRDQAFVAEKTIQKWSRAKKEALMRGDWDALSFFARPPSERVGMSAADNGVSTSLDMSGVESSVPRSPLMSTEVETPSGPRKPHRPSNHA